MFKIFHCIFNFNDLNGISEMMKSFFQNVNINEISEQYKDAFLNRHEEEYDFIQLEQYDDMYLLKIDLRGIDLRELSIKYKVGTIDINLIRLEIERSGLAIFSNNTVVKKRYNKEFEGIEDIDMNCVMKSIDNGVLSIRMPKKYVIDNSSKIIDVDNYEMETKGSKHNVDK